MFRITQVFRSVILLDTVQLDRLKYEISHVFLRHTVIYDVPIRSGMITDEEKNHDVVSVSMSRLDNIDMLKIGT